MPSRRNSENDKGLCVQLVSKVQRMRIACSDMCSFCLTCPPSLSCLKRFLILPVLVSIKQTTLPPHVATTPVSFPAKWFVFSLVSLSLHPVESKREVLQQHYIRQIETESVNSPSLWGSGSNKQLQTTVSLSLGSLSSNLLLPPKWQRIKLCGSYSATSGCNR